MKMLTCILLFAIAGASYAKDSDKMLQKSFKTSTGTTLNYLLFVPKNYSASQKYPLVVTLRAMGSDYIYQVDNNDQAHPWIEDSVQAKWPNFIMAPEPPDGAWGGMGASTGVLSNSAKAVLEAIEDLKKTYSLDTNRFIIGGFSIGGAGTYHQIELKPNYWAAACPVAAGGDSTKIESIAKTPIWHHQGSSDVGGAALLRMATALENHHYPDLRITCDMVLDANSGDGPAQWQKLIQNGTKPQDIIYKNAKPSYDSVSKAVDAGEKYIFQMITGANHEDSRINANHNPLLAKWAFSKVRGGGTNVSFVPVLSKPAETVLRPFGAIVTFGRPSQFAAGRTFTVLGRAATDQDSRNSYGVRILMVPKP